jgi:predicted metal-dependent phosphoesterase TrpH
MIDLHTHSTASDGTLTPTELVAAACAEGLSAIALTDHDTIAGIDEFLDAAAGSPLRAIPGVEVACSWYGASLHLVGLFIDHHDLSLKRLLERICTHRAERNRLILDALGAAGIDLTHDAVCECARGQVIGRPHFASALVRGGWCRDLQDAFTRFIGKGRPAYIRRFLPLPSEAVRTIHNAGGVAVWAHPLGGAPQSRKKKLRQVTNHLQKIGVDAMEVYYSDYTPAETERSLEIAKEFGMLLSGGSDYHGANMPGVELGRGRGKLCVPDDIVPALAEQAELRRRSET